jgi:hypothetical protein
MEMRFLPASFIRVHPRKSVAKKFSLIRDPLYAIRRVWHGFGSVGWAWMSHQSSTVA